MSSEEYSAKDIPNFSKIKMEKAKESMPKYSTSPFDQAALDEFKQKDKLFQMMSKSRSYTKHPANKALFDALALSLSVDEDDMEKEQEETPCSKEKRCIMIRSRTFNRSSKETAGEFVEVDLVATLWYFIRSTILKKRVEDVQLGVESYQTKLNLACPQGQVEGLDAKEPYTILHKPRGVVYLNKDDKKYLMRANEVATGSGKGCYIKYLDSDCSRHMTGVKQYMYKYSKESRLKVVFGDNFSGDTEGYGSMNCNGITFTRVPYVKDPTNAESVINNKVWRRAIQEEIDAIERNGTWKLADVPKGKKAISLKWIFTIEFNFDGTIQKPFFRLVARGYIQEHQIDFKETFSPVARFDTGRIILALVAQING
ncbi:retrovirus-related pol polyprotein from transposon TNT 1-94 [Tanacetum coccineum]